MKPEQHIIEKAKKIKLLLLDVDGVLTNGSIYVGPHQEEFKAFNIQDGLGIVLLQSTGVKVGIITRRQSEIVTHRAAELKIEHVYQGQKNKLDAFLEMLTICNIAAEEVAYMGDDLPDSIVLSRVGLGTTVSNGVDYIKERVHWISQHKGGKGAVRELCELLMHSQGTYEAACEAVMTK